MTEADFRTRQRIETNDSGSDHTDAVYNSARNDALQRISKATPADLLATLTIVSGTLSYAKPTRFLTMQTSETIPVSSIVGFTEVPKYRVVTANGAHLAVDEHFTIYGTNIVFATDPGVTASWPIYYGGTYLITDLPDEWVPIALDFATARIFDIKATAAASFFEYSMGPESVNRDGESAKWLKLRNARIAKAEEALAGITVADSIIGSIRIDRS